MLKKLLILNLCVLCIALFATPTLAAKIERVRGRFITLRLEKRDLKRIRVDQNYEVVDKKGALEGAIKITKISGGRALAQIISGKPRAGSKIGKQTSEVTDYHLDTLSEDDILIASKSVNFRANPAQLALSSIWFNFDYKFVKNLSFGPWLMFYFPTVATDVSNQDTDGIGLGIRSDLSLGSEVLKSGWVVSIFAGVLFSEVNITIKQVSKKYSTSGYNMGTLLARQVFWNNFNLTFGAGLQYGLIPHYKNIEVTAQGFTETFAQNPMRGFNPLLEVSFGYAL